MLETKIKEKTYIFALTKDITYIMIFSNKLKLIFWNEEAIK